MLLLIFPLKNCGFGCQMMFSLVRINELSCLLGFKGNWPFWASIILDLFSWVSIFFFSLFFVGWNSIWGFCTWLFSSNYGVFFFVLIFKLLCKWERDKEWKISIMFLYHSLLICRYCTLPVESNVDILYLFQIWHMVIFFNSLDLDICPLKTDSLCRDIAHRCYSVRFSF